MEMLGVITMFPWSGHHDILRLGERELGRKGGRGGRGGREEGGEEEREGEREENETHPHHPPCTHTCSNLLITSNTVVLCTLAT